MNHFAILNLMKKSMKKVIKRVGIILVVLILFIGAAGIYVNSIIPKPIGSPPELQEELFKRPDHPTVIQAKYIYKSASELATMIRRREVLSKDVVMEFLSNIKSNNYKYNALIWLREEEAIHDAELADERVLKGDTLNVPLLGVPITIKEMFWVKGSPSTLNAKMFGFIAPDDAVVVKQLKNAGAVILGTTNVSYMLGDYQTQGEVYPTGNNPYDTSRTPGGSTGGGAAALAAGFSTLELGSDLGGSIRIPAAFCGLYGLKPSLGSVNITQGTSPDTVTKFSRMALASAGPLARSVEDLQLMWEVLKNTPQDERFQHPIEWKKAPDKSLSEYKIAWIDEWKHGDQIVRVSNDVKEKMKLLLDSLSVNGVKVSKRAPDTYDEMKKLFLGTFASMMGEGQPWLLRKFISMDFKKLEDGSAAFQSFYDAMNDNSDSKWNELMSTRESLVRQWDSFFKEEDFFICPITYGVAIKKCPQGSMLNGDDGEMPYMSYFSYGYIFNATGHPSLVIPMGLNKDGLPVGLQIVSSYYNEDGLLKFAKLISPFTSHFIFPTK